MDRKNSSRGLTSNQLKLIAIIAMTVDHLTWAFFPGFQRIWYVMALHVIGRLTAPIMWFFIAEGAHYTHNAKKYIVRLFVFAVISHFAYDFAFGIPFWGMAAGPFNRTSVMWSLALGAMAIVVCREESVSVWKKYAVIFIGCVLAFPSDWSTIAMMAPFFLYDHRGNFKRQAVDLVIWTAVYAAVYILFLDKSYGLLQMFTCLSIPLLKQYRGERGRWRGMKWLFYIYYPAHLVVIGLIRVALHGNIPIIF